jgi:pimeloyl-ACP methyl ester carboxylesterase
MQRTWSKGVEIAFEDADGPDPALVLIHPACSNRSHYSQVLASLRGRYRAITLDLRGHGDSGAPAEGYRIDDFADDVIAVCREAGVERAVICGHSMAGVVGLTVAAREPELAAGVVLLDSTVLMPEPIRTQALATFVPALEGPRWLDALRGYFDGRMFGPYDPPEVKARVLEQLAVVPPQMLPEMFRDIFMSDYADVLVNARCPVLSIHAWIPADLERLRELRPDALVAEVIGSGHFLALVIPDQVASILDRFVTILPTAAGQMVERSVV